MSDKDRLFELLKGTPYQQLNFDYIRRDGKTIQNPVSAQSYLFYGAVVAASKSSNSPKAFSHDDPIFPFVLCTEKYVSKLTGIKRTCQSKCIQELIDAQWIEKSHMRKHGIELRFVKPLVELSMSSTDTVRPDGTLICEDDEELHADYVILNFSVAKKMGMPLYMVFSALVQQFSYRDQKRQLDEDGYFFMSQQDVSTKTGFCVRTVSTKLKKLVDLKIIVVKKRFNGATHFKFCVDALEKYMTNA